MSVESSMMTKNPHEQALLAASQEYLQPEPHCHTPAMQFAVRKYLEVLLDDPRVSDLVHDAIADAHYATGGQSNRCYSSTGDMTHAALKAIRRIAGLP